MRTGYDLELVHLTKRYGDTVAVHALALARFLPARLLMARLRPRALHGALALAL